MDWAVADNFTDEAGIDELLPEVGVALVEVEEVGFWAMSRKTPVQVNRRMFCQVDLN
jgi:hypothetical protein